MNNTSLIGSKHEERIRLGSEAVDALDNKMSEIIADKLTDTVKKVKMTKEDIKNILPDERDHLVIASEAKAYEWITAF